VDYVNALLTLISRSTDHQAAFGNGRCDYETLNVKLNSGTLNTAGQFFGYSDNDTARVKVFWCEDWWGNIPDRVAGMIMKGGKIFVKMTPPYNLTGEDYTDTGVSPAGAEGYITKMQFGPYGKLPSEAGDSGSGTAYWADYLTWGLFDNAYAMVGGGDFMGGTPYLKPGSFCLNLDYHYWTAGGFGASLSALP
jgi:hypothetical protein